jgi:hypothetical protein
MTISESADERDIRVQELTAELRNANCKQQEHTLRYNRTLEGINIILSTLTPIFCREYIKSESFI